MPRLDSPTRHWVSIQLVSPASGEPRDAYIVGKVDGKNVSIQLVSPASGEWKAAVSVASGLVQVSIQLVSPASGETVDSPAALALAICPSILWVSIQLVSPASGELKHKIPDRWSAYEFPFN